MIHLLVMSGLSAALITLAASRRGGALLSRRFDDGRRIRLLLLWVGALALLANLACIVLPIPELVCDVITAVTVIIFALMAVILLRAMFAVRLVRPVRSTVLAVGAHPDDLELACGGTLAKLADSGYDVHALIMSAGQMGGDSLVRPDEARAGGDYLGVAGVEVLQHPDTRLIEASNAMVQDIEARIRALQPDLILTHSEHDQHQDHHAVHQALLRAARRHPSILCFESPSVTRSFNPSIYVDIGSYVHVKIRAIEQHRDQLGKPYMTGERVRAIAAFRGNQARTRYAEGFEPVRMLASTPDPLWASGPAERSTAEADPALHASAPMGLAEPNRVMTSENQRDLLRGKGHTDRTTSNQEMTA